MSPSATSATRSCSISSYRFGSRPPGELFRDVEGHPSLYAPGHGDLFSALRRSGTLDALRDRGVRLVTVLNVDNLGARVDPMVVGAHLASGKPLTCEVARKEGDMGGAPVRVDGRLQLLEGPRFPPDFDQETVPVFNTNTALLHVDVLDAEHDLSWLYVLKDVEGRPAVQLERLYHEVSAFVETQYLEVPRRGETAASSRSRRRRISSERPTTSASSSRHPSDTKA